MKLSGIQKLTLLDFPGKTAATVFTPGCDFRCPFCHNAELVDIDDAFDAMPDYPLESFFALLDKRHGLLDGVCVTGGEPLMQSGLEDFLARIKREGFAVKLDTNGSFPDRLQRILDAGVVDYVAMDVKNAPERYGETTGMDGLDIAPLRASLDMLMQGGVPFELRTTVVRELHTADNLQDLARWIDGAPAWFLQSYVDSETVLAGPGKLHAWDPADLRALLPRLREIIPNTQLRGID